MSKSLIDKIIDILEHRKGYQKKYGSSQCKQELEGAILEIKKLEEEADFEQVTRVLIKHLNNPTKYHPHHKVIVDSGCAELVEGLKCVTTEDYFKD